MATGTVVLGRCSPLLRDLLRRLLLPEFDVVESCPSSTGAPGPSATTEATAKPSTNHPAMGVIAYLYVGESMDDVAQRSAVCDVPVVAVTGDVRRAVRFRAGIREREVNDLSAGELRRLLRA